MKHCSVQAEGFVLGLDLGDRKSHYALLNPGGEVVEEGSVPTTEQWMGSLFDNVPVGRVVMEVGTHSRWVSRLAEERGQETIVANARRLRLIYEADQKTDRVDAESLGRLGRLDAKLLSPIHHRGRQAQADLGLLRSREALVKARTQLINHARGLVKAWGGRLPKCSAASFHRRVAEAIPAELKAALGPIVGVIEQLSREIRGYEQKIAQRAEAYPEIAQLQQIDGVGPLTSAAYVWTLEDANRFDHSRQVGAYLGLVPRRDQSGAVDRRLGITKAGDEALRRLLVQSAHYILGPFGQDCDLRRFGEHLLGAGESPAKRRAVVAVARKLSVLMHHLWVTGQDYDPLYQAHRQEQSVSVQ
jgi:transposase